MSLTLEEAKFIGRQLGENYVYGANVLNSAWVTDEVFAEALASLHGPFVQRLTMAAGVRYRDYGQLTGLPKQVGEGTITQGQSTATKAISHALRRLCDAIRQRRPKLPRKPFVTRLTCPHCGLEVQITYQLQKPTPEQSASGAQI